MSATSPTTDEPQGAPALGLRRGAWWAVGLFIALKIWLSPTRYLNQDEFESLHQAWLLSVGRVQYGDFHSNHPPLAFLCLSTLYRWVSDPVVIIWLARFMTACSSLLVLALVGSLARTIYGVAAGSAAVMLYALSATFCEWSLEIRTDFLMVPLWLASLRSLLGDTRWPRRRLLFSGACYAAAFWANQKACFHIVPVLALLIGPIATLPQRWPQRVVDLMWWGVGCLLPTLAMVGHMLVTGAWNGLWEHNFGGALELMQEAPYRAFLGFTLTSLLSRDGGLVLITVASWCVGPAAAAEWRWHRWVMGSGLWMLFTLFLTPGPFPYYLMSVLPLWAVSSGRLVADWWLGRFQGAFVRRINWRWSLPWAACAYCVLPAMRLTHLLSPTQLYQQQVLRVAHALTTQDEAVFDGAGALLNRPDAYAFYWVLWSPQREALRRGLLPPIGPTLRQHECHLVIDNYRLRDLPESDQAILARQFVKYWGPLRVPGYDSQSACDQRERAFELWVDGTYRSNRDDLRIDGQPWRSGSRLTAGPHTLQVAGDPGRVVLRRDPSRLITQLPRDDERPLQFLGAYGYCY